MAKYGLITDNVAMLLGKYPNIANDDKLFMITYWKECDKVTCLEDIVNATSPDTLTRIKRRYLKRGMQDV